MITVYNIRGTNGSGKSTLARSFIKGDPAAAPNRFGTEGSPTMVDLTWYDAPTKRDPRRRLSVQGYAGPRLHPGLDVLVVGPYRTACGGLDGVQSFDLSFQALNRGIELMAQYGTEPERAIVCEGVISSTVWGSWGEYAKKVTGERAVDFAFCYLDTPLEVCLDRIRGRQQAAGKERQIKEELVSDKIRAIAATREKALAAGHLVYDLPWAEPVAPLTAIMMNLSGARDMHRA
jgi:hypothetical protein